MGYVSKSAIFTFIASFTIAKYHILIIMLKTRRKSRLVIARASSSDGSYYRISPEFIRGFTAISSDTHVYRHLRLSTSFCFKFYQVLFERSGVSVRERSTGDKHLTFFPVFDVSIRRMLFPEPIRLI